MEIMKAPNDITKTENVKEAWNKIEFSVHKMGFDYCVYSYVGINRNTFEIITTKNAIDWVKHYISSGYSKYDPIARAMFGKEQLIWNLVDEKNKITKKMMDDGRNYGMYSGITVPIINKFGDFASGLSLSTKAGYKNLNNIINAPLFYENVYDIHIKTVSRTLSKTAGIDFDFCYAIVLSQYTNQINVISQKTGFLVDDLHKLYSHLYLYHHNIDFFCLDIQQATVNCVKDLHYFLKESDSLKYKFPKREMDCIELIKKGLTAKQAARVLDISPRTFEWYTNKLKQKLGCNNQRELIFKLTNRQLIIK